MTIGNAIRSIRKHQRLRQSEVASIVGISSGYLSQIENDKREPNLSTLKLIGSALNTPLPLLFFLCIQEEEILPEKLPLFRQIKPIMDSLFFSLIEGERTDG